MPKPSPKINNAQLGAVVALYPELGATLNLAKFLLRARKRRLAAEKRHCEQGGPKRPYEQALEHEETVAACLEGFMSDWHTPGAPI